MSGIEIKISYYFCCFNSMLDAVQTVEKPPLQKMLLCSQLEALAGDRYYESKATGAFVEFIINY